ncbi:MAG: ATP-dependent DNA helicase UvrD2 [Acidimicrobiales bacterium]
MSDVERRPQPGVDRVRPTTSRDRWSTLAGPAVLGRSVLLTPGVEVPAPWAGAERITLDEESLNSTSTLRTVRHAYLTRTPMVYEVATGLRVPDRGVDRREVWAIAPNLDFVAEATLRLARANAVDARDVATPTWPLIALAQAAGALPASQHDADVLVGDDTLAWCDGGPVHLWDLDDAQLGGAMVIPRVALTRGLLTPIAAHPPAASLAPDQLAAVVDPTTRARVIAPAGSGKTRVLTERARHVLNAGVPSDALLLVAFNKRAQGEMRERTSDHPRLQIQTLNALALSIVNGTNGFFSRGVRRQHASERDVRDIIATYVKLPRRANTDPAVAWIDALSEVRLGLRPPQSVEDEYQGDLEGFADFFPQFRQHLATHQLADFDEQVYLALETLLREPEVRLAAERRAEILLVDEFQDLTPAHMLLLRLLAGPSLSIFAVGDDDQTIYGFSGATPEWLVRFEDHVPDAVQHALEVNYRCPAPVVEATTNLLSHNTVRVAKQIRPGPTSVRTPDSYSVAVVDDQVEHVRNTVRRLLDVGTPPSQIAVLSRVNANLVPVQVSLLGAGIAVNVRDGGEFLRSSGVQAALAWLRLAVQPDRLVGTDVMFAAHRPGRGIQPRAREWMGEQSSIDGLRQLARRLDERTAKKIDEFVRDLELVAKFSKRATTSALIEFIRGDIGLERSLATLDHAHMGRNQALNSDGLRSLVALGRQHTNPSTFDSWLRGMLEVPSDESGVVLATVHKVKGLEWPHVIVYDASATVFPHRLSDDLEEERRVFHVAITRCISSLTITAASGEPSPFLDELAVPFDATKGPRHDTGNQGPSESGSVFSPIIAEIGQRFTWGGYDFEIRSIEPDGVTVATGSTRPTQIPFGWTVVVNGRSRTLVAPGRVKSSSSAGSAVDANLYTALKSWRMEQARADKVPAYVIFNDKTLEELCRVQPGSIRELLLISGIGPAKADRYGDQIVAVIVEGVAKATT